MNKNLHVFILKLYKNKQRGLVISRNLNLPIFPNISLLNLLGMFQKIGKFEYLIIQVIKEKFEVKKIDLFHFLRHKQLESSVQTVV